MPNDKLNVFSCPAPFDKHRHDFIVDFGVSISDILKEVNMEVLLGKDVDACIFIDDNLIPRQDWDLTFPHAGASVAVNVIPAGGETGKNIMRVAAVIAVVALSVWAAPAVAGLVGVESLAGVAMVGSGLSMVGTLAVNALIPPPDPYSGSDDALGIPNSGSMLGTNNRILPYGEIPNHVGKTKVFPPLGAQTYTETYGSDVYVRMLMVAGIGEYHVTLPKIGNTGIDNFDDYEIADGDKDDADIQRLYGNDVSEKVKNIKLEQSAGWQTDTTELATEEISIDITAPLGISQQYDSGNIRPFFVIVEAEYSVAGENVWNAFPDSPKRVQIFVEGRHSFGMRKDGLTAEQYDVRVKKTGGGDHPPVDSGAIYQINDIYWTALRSIKHSPPWTLANVHLIALRIRITGQVNSQVDTFNCLLERLLPIYEESSGWSANTLTRNPAWAYAEVLRGSANHKPVVDGDVNGDDLLEWADWCDANGFYCDGDIGLGRTVFDTIQLIAAAGRASRGWKNGKYTVVRDKTQTTEAQHFSLRNSWGYKGKKTWIDLPHAIKCRFRSEDSDYQPDEQIVCTDGYFSTAPAGATTWEAETAYEVDDWVYSSVFTGYYYRCTSAGTSSASTWSPPFTPRELYTEGTVTWMTYYVASVFESMDFPLVVDKDQVWKLARYHMSVVYGRPEDHFINVDFEHILCNRGDLVGFTNTIIKLGLGDARIKAINADSIGDVDSITMDNTLTMEAGKSYAARIRKKTGVFVDVLIVTDEGNQTTISFDPEIPFANAPDAGDMIFYGEAGSVYEKYIVNSIRHFNNYSALLGLINYDEDILSADQETIPTWTPNITEPLEINRVPATPVIKSMLVDRWSDIQIHGNQVLQLQATLSFAGGIGDIGVNIDPEYYEAQYRIVDPDSTAYHSPWISIRNIPLDQRYAKFRVENSMVYDFRVRAVSKYGQASEWDNETDYEIVYVSSTPADVAGLALVQGGSTYKGSDIEVLWNPASDTWRVTKYQINVYKTAGTVLLRTEYRDVGDAFFSYKLQMNVEDNAGTPVDGITFRVWAVSQNDDTSDNYASLGVSAAAPSPPSALVLVQGGSAFPGRDVELSWTADSDPYWVRKYKIEVYKTVGSVLLRTEYRDVDDAFYSYAFQTNSEDNSGTPITGLTFKVYSISMFNVESATSSDKAVTNSLPGNVAGTTADARMGGVDFSWTANAEADFSHYKYRVLVEGGSYSDYYITKSNRVQRMLTDAEKTASGYDANITIQVLAVDVFSQQSTVAGTDNADCLGLAVAIADVPDFLLTPSKFSIPIPIITGLTITDNSPSAGYVAWTAFNLYLGGTLYSINAGNSPTEFICFKDLNTTLFEINTHPSENYANWDPAEDFLIIWNSGGTGKEAWSTFMNLVATSAFIGTAAIGNAHINDLDAGKINAGFLDAARINTGIITFAKLNSNATNLMFDSSTRDFADIGGATKPANNADVTSASPQGLSWIDGTSGNLTIGTGGKLYISAVDGIEIQAGGNLNVLDGGDIVLQADDSNPSFITWKDGSTAQFHLTSDTVGRDNRIGFWPETANTGYFNLGIDIPAEGSKPFDYIEMFGRQRIRLKAFWDADWAAQIDLITTSSSGVINLGVENDGGINWEYVELRGTFFGPSTVSHGVLDLGRDSYRWKNLFLSGYAQITDYLIAEGGIHVGGSSDPGTDNLIVDGVLSTGRMNTTGGVHVGGTSDPGTDNLLVDGSAEINSALPTFRFRESGGPSDQTIAEWYVDAGVLHGRFVNDAYSLAEGFMAVSRNTSTYTVKQILFTGDNITLTGDTEITGSNFRISNGHTPSGSGDTGLQGRICWDTNYLYVCTGANTWTRIALAW